MVGQHAAYAVPAPAMAEQPDRKRREVAAVLHKVEGIIQIDDPLREAAHAVAFALVVAGSVIGKHIIPVLRKIIRAVHIGIMPAAVAVRDDNHPVLVLPRAVEVSRQFLSLVGREFVFRALQAFKILYIIQQRLVALVTLVDIHVINDNGQHPPTAERQQEQPQQNPPRNPEPDV